MSLRETTTAALILACAAALFSFRGIYEPDLWWHLAQGREDAAGRLVRTNVFGATYGDYRQPYTSWLFDVGGYVLEARGGIAALQGAQAVSLLTAFLALYAACRQRAGTAASIAVMALALVVIEPRAIPRPHLASFAGLAVVSLLVARATAGRTARPLWWAVPLVAVWSNLHLECVFGVALVGLYAAGEAIHPVSLTRRDAARGLLVTVVCAVALLANPYGVGLLRYLVENASVPSIVAIAELQPPYLPAYRAFYAWVALVAVVLALRPRALALWEVLAAALFAGLGLRYLRLTPLLVLAAAPIVAARLSAWIPHPFDPRAVVVTALAAMLALSRLPPAAYAAEWQIGGDAFAPAAFVSEGAVRFVRRAGIDGPAFTSFNAGGYVAWRLYPRARTFQDSRLQAWPPSRFASILQAAGSQTAWDDLVRGVDWAFVSRRQPNQLSGVGMFPDGAWALVYWDDAAEVRVRREGRLAAVAAAHEYRQVRPDADVFDLAGRVHASGGAAIVGEARRLAESDPDRLAPAAILCAAGEPSACEALDRLARRVPALGDPVRRLRASTSPAAGRPADSGRR